MTGDKQVKVLPPEVLQVSQDVADNLAQAAVPVTALPVAAGASPIDAAAVGAATAISGRVAGASAELAPRAPAGLAASAQAVSGLQSGDEGNAADVLAVGLQAQATEPLVAGSGAAGAGGGIGEMLGTVTQVVPAVLSAVTSPLSSLGQLPQSAMGGLSQPASMLSNLTKSPGIEDNSAGGQAPLPPYEDTTGAIHPRSGPYDQAPPRPTTPPAPAPAPTEGSALPPYQDTTGAIHPRSGPFEAPKPADPWVTTAPGALGPYGYYEPVPGSGKWLPEGTPAPSRRPT
jgi:hypothetical protein